MKLRNKKTGKIIESDELLTDKFILDLFSRDFDYFNSKLHKIQDEWEDYEEPKKEYWYICSTRKNEITNVVIDDGTDYDAVQKDKEIGNYFETIEEAEKAVEKLKAWKRLKDKGFVFKGINMGDGSIKTGLSKGVSLDDCEGFYSDMEFLFGV